MNAKTVIALGACVMGAAVCAAETNAVVRVFREAAEQGNRSAQYQLGEFYEKGQGVEQSYTEAAKWYRAAAEQGYPLAQAKLREGREKGLSEKIYVGILVVALVVVLFIVLSIRDIRKGKKNQVESDSLCGADKCSATTAGEDEESKTPPEGDKTSDTSVLNQVKKPWKSFEGRARRSEYWLKAIFLGGIDIGIGYWLCFLGICGSLASSENGGLLIIFGVSLILFAIPWVLSVTVRRFHDRNMSGWWVVLYWSFNLGLAFFVPVVAWIVGMVFFVILACMDGTPGSNQYGKNPKEEVSRLSKGDTSVDSCQQKSDSEPVLQSEVKLDKPSIESRLALIKDLFERGVITEEEYNHKREAIIAEI